MAELIKVKPCPFCGCELEWHDEEHINKNGHTVRSKYYMHTPNECVLDLIDAPFVIGCGNSLEYTEAWNNRVNEFDAEKYEKLVLADMERKHTENQELLSELKSVLPTTTESEIRAKAIDDIFEIMDNAVAHSSHERECLSFWVGFLQAEIAEQLKGE